MRDSALLRCLLLGGPHIVEDVADDAAQGVRRERLLKERRPRAERLLLHHRIVRCSRT